MKYDTFFFIKWTIFGFLNNALKPDLFPVWIQDSDTPQLFSGDTGSSPIITLQQASATGDSFSHLFSLSMSLYTTLHLIISYC